MRRGLAFNLTKSNILMIDLSQVDVDVEWVNARLQSIALSDRFRIAQVFIAVNKRHVKLCQRRFTPEHRRTGGNDCNSDQLCQPRRSACYFSLICHSLSLLLYWNVLDFRSTAKIVDITESNLVADADARRDADR